MDISDIFTIKDRPAKSQIKKLMELADKFPYLGDEIVHMVQRKIGGRLFSIFPIADQKKMTIAGLLTLLYSDILTSPSTISRERLIVKFKQVSEELGVTLNDIKLLTDYISEIETVVGSPFGAKLSKES